MKYIKIVVLGGREVQWKVDEGISVDELINMIEKGLALLGTKVSS